MWFWIIVLAVFAAVLALAWRRDRRRGVRKGGIPGPQDDAGVGAAKAERWTREIKGLGPNGNR